MKIAFLYLVPPNKEEVRSSTLKRFPENKELLFIDVGEEGWYDELRNKGVTDVLIDVSETEILSFIYPYEEPSSKGFLRVHLYPSLDLSFEKAFEDKKYDKEEVKYLIVLALPFDPQKETLKDFILINLLYKNDDANLNRLLRQKLFSPKDLFSYLSYNAQAKKALSFLVKYLLKEYRSEETIGEIMAFLEEIRCFDDEPFYQKIAQRLESSG